MNLDDKEMNLPSFKLEWKSPLYPGRFLIMEPEEAMNGRSRATKTTQLHLQPIWPYTGTRFSCFNHMLITKP
ncbi:alpha-mannosidase [Sesbania bispinosa]|nr:alpha-mannosidase [Sesbania bispinosa]